MIDDLPRYCISYGISQLEMYTRGSNGCLRSYIWKNEVAVPNDVTTTCSVEVQNAHVLVHAGVLLPPIWNSQTLEEVCCFFSFVSLFYFSGSIGVDPYMPRRSIGHGRSVGCPDSVPLYPGSVFWEEISQM